jgi:hypothetical protein
VFPDHFWGERAVSLSSCAPDDGSKIRTLTTWKVTARVPSVALTLS